jgi:hypothetical protein
MLLQTVKNGGIGQGPCRKKRVCNRRCLLARFRSVLARGTEAIPGVFARPTHHRLMHRDDQVQRTKYAGAHRGFVISCGKVEQRGQLNSFCCSYRTFGGYSFSSLQRWLGHHDGFGGPRARCADEHGFPSRIRPGHRPPVQRSEIAR